MNQAYMFTDYGGPENQKLIDQTVPEPGPGELAVAVRAAAVNPADWKIRAGDFGRKRRPPGRMGLEVSGVVTALGDGVENFNVGDEVLGPVTRSHGGFVEHTVVVAQNAVAKPEDLSFAGAATLPVAGATAYDATHQLELGAGQTLLIVGIGGGIGMMAAQIGDARGLRVLGTASEAKRTVVESVGATLVPRGDDLPARIRAVVPDGVDVIVDLVGGDALREVAGLVADPARIVSVADPKTAAELGGLGLERGPDALAKMTELVEYGLVTPNVSELFPLERADEAIAAVESGHATGKIVIEMPTSA